MRRALTALALSLVVHGAPSAQQASMDHPVSSEIQAPGPNAPLAGTLLDAGAGTPVVLMLPGSGPTDRDGNNALGVHAASTRMLAEALAARGISTVRTDKRGMFGSKAAIPDPNKVTIGDYAADAHGWIATIRAARGVPCVWLMGHSEGGLIALDAAQAPEGICGLVLIESPGRPLGDAMREQFAASPNISANLQVALDALAQLEAGKTVDAATLPSPLNAIFYPAVQPFLIDMLARDPAKLAAAYSGPMLIISGERDLQISPADAAALHAARPDSTLVTVPGMTHVLKHVASDDRAANIATYATAGLPLADGLVDAVAGFIAAHSAHSAQTAE